MKKGCYLAPFSFAKERSILFMLLHRSLPYCFSDGAQELCASAIEAFGDLSNDIEVGLYCSNAGGDIAEWHSDANHNFTIQLTGVKDWQVVDLPEDPTSLLLRGERSRGLFDAPHNRAEQLLGTTATAAAKSYSLAPGSVLYVPPGHPHRVVPSAGGSLSVDVRIGHISHAKWVSEVLYASLMHAALSHSLDAQAARPCNAAMIASQPVGPSDDVSLLLAGEGLAARIGQCCLPRAFPFEREFSDGLNRGGSLDFLEARGFMASRHLLVNAYVDLSPLIAMSLQWRDESTICVSIICTSGLTGLEHCRYRLICDACLYDCMSMLITSGAPVAVNELMASCKDRDKLWVMLRCLLHSNTVFVVKALKQNQISTGVPPTGSKRVSKRRRR